MCLALALLQGHQKLHAGETSPRSQADLCGSICNELVPSGCPDLPATLAILSASWFFGVLERFWLRCLPPVDRMLRRWTSVALKKATMKGCLFWGPCRPIRPANLGLMLWPAGEVFITQRCNGQGQAGGHDSTPTSQTIHTLAGHSSNKD